MRPVFLVLNAGSSSIKFQLFDAGGNGEPRRIYRGLFEGLGSSPHFLVRDEPNLARFQSGLMTLAGKSKPAYTAYQLPLVETGRTGTRTALWGQLRAPGSGSSARIERLSGGAWRPVATVHPGAGRFFRWVGTLPRGAQVRLHAGSLVGPTITIV